VAEIKKRTGHSPDVTERNKARHKEREKRKMASGRKAKGGHPTVTFKANVEAEDQHRRRQLDAKNYRKYCTMPPHLVPKSLKKRLRGKDWFVHQSIKEKLKEAHEEPAAAQV